MTAKCNWKRSGLRNILLATPLLLLLLTVTTSLFAQTPEEPKEVKILKEYYDGKGNVVREIQFKQGMMLVTQTIIKPREVSIGYWAPVNPDTINKDSVLLLVDKRHYSLKVYYNGRVIRAYKAVFGPDPLQNKCMEGDRCTPEGIFTINYINQRSKYNKFFQINYPNDSSYARFNKLKQNGALPSGARIGGNIGIHGIWKGGDNLIDLGVGWTDGCVALRNKDIEDLYALIGVGTRVYIKK